MTNDIQWALERAVASLGINAEATGVVDGRSEGEISWVSKSLGEPVRVLVWRSVARHFPPSPFETLGSGHTLYHCGADLLSGQSVLPWADIRIVRATLRHLTAWCAAADWQADTALSEVAPRN